MAKKLIWDVIEDADPLFSNDHDKRLYRLFRKREKRNADRNGNGDDVFTGSNVKQASLPTHQYESEELDEAERTSAYKFTVKQGDPEGKLRDFRRLTKLHNIAKRANHLSPNYQAHKDAEDSPLLKVTVRDRLGKNNPNAHLQNKRSGAGPQIIKRGHGERQDVYLHKAGRYARTYEDLDEAVFGAERYNWRKYTGRGHTLYFRGQPHTLKRGDTFGIRDATSASAHRVIVPHMGETRVMSVHRDEGYHLLAHSQHHREMHDVLRMRREDVEQIDELSGAKLGAYVQAAHKDIDKRRQHQKDIEAHPSVAKHIERRRELSRERVGYDRHGRSRNHAKRETAERREHEAKHKLDPNYSKNVATWKRHRGIETAIKKLQSGKLSEERTQKQKDKQTRDASEFVNSHREAVGRPKFKFKDRRHIAKHLNKVRKNAAYGNDPWDKDAD